MPERKRAMFTMSVAAEGAKGEPLRGSHESRVTSDECAADGHPLSTQDSALGTASQCEARAVASAVEVLSVLVSAPDSARRHIGRAQAGGEGA